MSNRIPYMSREQYSKLYASGKLWEIWPEAQGNYLEDVAPEHINLIMQSESEAGGSTPSQYELPEYAEELQDLIEYREMNFAIGNIFKACYRMGHCDHSDALRDLRKMRWFIERELTRVEGEEL